MHVNDLLSLLERLQGLYQEDKRSTPELAVLLRAYQAGGRCSFDLVAWASQLGEQPHRLERRLRRLSQIGAWYCPAAGGQPATLELAARPRAGARAVEPAGAPAVAAAGHLPAAAAAGAPGSGSSSGSLLSVLISGLRPGHSRVAVLPIEGDEGVWRERAREILLGAGATAFTDDDLCAGAIAVYSAADYLGGWAVLQEVVGKAFEKTPEGDWRGWKYYFRRSLLEYLTRKKNLDSLGAEVGFLDPDQEVPLPDIPAPDHPIVTCLLANLDDRLDPAVVSAWFRPATFTIQGTSIELTFSDPYFAEWIRKNYALDLRLAAMDLGLQVSVRDRCNEIPTKPSASSAGSSSPRATADDPELPAAAAAITSAAP